MAANPISGQRPHRAVVPLMMMMVMMTMTPTTIKLEVKASVRSQCDNELNICFMYMICAVCPTHFIVHLTINFF
jgi:hypothetical protein